MPEDITTRRRTRESEGFIVAMKPSNVGGAKGPYRERVFANEERPAWTFVPLRNPRQTAILIDLRTNRK
jgi:hypothetical protein